MTKPRRLIWGWPGFTALALGAVLGGCRAPTAAIVERLGAPITRGDDRDRLAAERRRMAETKGVWRDRSGLTIDTSEGMQLRFIDAGECEGFDTCRRATYWGERPLSGEGPDGLTKTDFAVVEVFHGEGRDWYGVDRRDGELINVGVDAPLAAPDGRHWAAGGCDEIDGCRFTLWRGSEAAEPEPVTVLRTPPGCCEVEGWRDAATLRVRIDTDENVETDKPALVVRGADGSWSLADAPALRPAPER